MTENKMDARKLDHKTLEAMRLRAVRQVQAGESPELVARVLRISRGVSCDMSREAHLAEGASDLW